MSSPHKITLVAYDAGGAEILASYIDHNDIHANLIIDGPAFKIFKNRFKTLDTVSFEFGISNCEWVLCGSGWQSDLEWRAIKRGRELGKYVICFLDHWVNYAERFIRNGIQSLPNEIWVGDAEAKKIALNLFPKLPIKLVPNPYILDLKLKLREINLSTESKRDSQKKNRTEILFVCENISEHALQRYGDKKYLGYNEFDAIQFFLENIKLISDDNPVVILRPHPSDKPEKYFNIIKRHSEFVRLSECEPLIYEIAKTDIVVGCESMAMVIGLLANKKVVSSIPKFGSPCRLPQKDIIHLANLFDQKRSVKL